MVDALYDDALDDDVVDGDTVNSEEVDVVELDDELDEVDLKEYCSDDKELDAVLDDEEL